MGSVHVPVSTTNLRRRCAGTEGGRKVTCIVCFDDFRVADGIECAGSPPEGAHGKRGPKHREALQACSDVIAGNKPSMTARRAFIAAAREASVFVSDKAAS